MEAKVTRIDKKVSKTGTDYYIVWVFINGATVKIPHFTKPDFDVERIVELSIEPDRYCNAVVRIDGVY